MFCGKCGKPVNDGDSFCRFCGAPLQEAVACNQHVPDKFTLTIDRKSQIYLINPSIKVVIDGESRLSVDNGKTEKIDLAAGTHKIELSCSFRSKTISLDLQSNTVLEIGFNRISGALTAEVK